MCKLDESAEMEAYLALNLATDDVHFKYLLINLRLLPTKKHSRVYANSAMTSTSYATTSTPSA